MYKKGFFLEEAVGNNIFSYDIRKNKKLWIPELITIDDLDLIELQDDETKVAFEDYDFDDKLSTNYGLKNFYKINFPGKDIYLFDNHNHAFYFWYASRKKGLITDNSLLIHIDEHADTRDNNKSIVKPDSYELEKVFHFTNYTLNVGDYIIPAQQEGIIGEVVQVRNTQNLEEFISKEKNGDFDNINQDIILNLDLDFFQPDLDFIDYELKKKVVLQAFDKAKVITISTSPFFIDQTLALEVFKGLFQEKFKNI